MRVRNTILALACTVGLLAAAAPALSQENQPQPIPPQPNQPNPPNQPPTNQPYQPGQPSNPSHPSPQTNRPVGTEQKGEMECTMTFTLKGWSAFYKTAKGDGTVTCPDGQTLKVDVKATGGGVTFGKSEILNGKGTFHGVSTIQDVLGSYAQADAHAGAGKSGEAAAMVKDNVGLTLTGTGKGVDVGFAFGKFTLAKFGTLQDTDKEEQTEHK